MKNEQWKGRKKEHCWEFQGFDKKTGIHYSSCAYCNKMKADGELMTKKEISEHWKRPTSDFNW